MEIEPRNQQFGRPTLFLDAEGNSDLVVNRGTMSSFTPSKAQSMAQYFTSRDTGDPCLAL